ncbi:MAG TPA: hypothetical protein VFV19_15285 [Candidatus Polarisedimenticolaceae bacterium]|nr:hypothetical protein [Candidatus Polarisedimenticolaceae bacterium]
MKGHGAAVLAIVSLLGACGVPPTISDTGYRGTWRRGNDRNVSIVAITRVGERWLFRWTKRSFDGKYSILCDWNGHCEEKLNGQLVATYAITTRYDDAKLYTDTVEERLIPDKQTFRYTDVMEVKDDGMTLWNYTLDRDGNHYEGAGRPQRSFAKVADGIAEPPRAP